MIDTNWSDRLLEFFKAMLGFYGDFLTFEREKYSVIVSGELVKLDGSLKREQAFVLKARGLDSDRQKLLEQAGAADCTFRELIPLVEPSRQAELQRVYGEICSTISDIQNVNRRCSQMTKLKMNRISRVLSEMENHPELRQIYGSKLQGHMETDSTFSRKI